jgi:hypothetical protein
VGATKIVNYFGMNFEICDIGISLAKKSMDKRTWFVDVNEFEPMLNGSSLIVREYNNDNNGENDGLMIIGLNEVNRNIRGGLSCDDAYLIAAAPEMLKALQNLENDSGAIPKHAWDMVQNAIKKALGYE